MDPIAPFDPYIAECLDDFGESVGGAACQDDLRPIGIGHIRVEVLAGELADEGEQRGITLCGAVLQRGEQVDLTLDVFRLALLGHFHMVRSGRFVGTQNLDIVRGIDWSDGRGFKAVRVCNCRLERVIGEV